MNLVDIEGIYSYRIVYIALVATVKASLSSTCGRGYLRPTPWVCTRGSIRLKELLQGPLRVVQRFRNKLGELAELCAFHLDRCNLRQESHRSMNDGVPLSCIELGASPDQAPGVFGREAGDSAGTHSYGNNPSNVVDECIGDFATAGVARERDDGAEIIALLAQVLSWQSERRGWLRGRRFGIDWRQTRSQAQALARCPMAGQHSEN